jgi:L-ribulokinase
MAVLANFARRSGETSLEDFLDQEVFKEPESMTLSPEPERVAGYREFIQRYQAGLPVEATAGQAIND